MTYPPYPDMPPQEPPGPGGDPLVPVDLNDWWAKTVAVVRRSWPRLAAVQTLAAVGVLVDTLLNGGGGAVAPATVSSGNLLVSLLGTAATMVLTLFALGASVRIAVRDAAGRPEPLGAALGSAASRALPLLGWSLLAGLLVVAGLVALVLPGLYVIVVLSGSFAGVVMIERRSLGRCFQLVNRRFVPTLARFALFALLALAWSVVTALVAVGPTGVRAVVAAVLAVPLGVASAAYGVVTYAELRWHERPGTGTPDLVAELDR